MHLALFKQPTIHKIFVTIVSGAVILGVQVIYRLQFGPIRDLLHRQKVVDKYAVSCRSASRVFTRFSVQTVTLSPYDNPNTSTNLTLILSLSPPVILPD